MRRTLQVSLPDSDPRVVSSLFDVAMMHASLGSFTESWSSYSLAQKQALAIERRDIAAAARLRRAAQPFEPRRPLRAPELRAIAGDPDPMVRSSRIAALVLLGQIDRVQAGSEHRRLDRGAARGQAQAAGPAVRRRSTCRRRTRSSGRARSAGLCACFRPTISTTGGSISASGCSPTARVSDIEILRSGGPTDWTPRS